MAEISLGKGKRMTKLAKLIIESDPTLHLEDTESGWSITGAYITVTKEMVAEACFANSVKNSKTIEQMLYGLALKRKGRLVVQTEDKIVIGEDDGERPMTIRLRIDQQQELAKYADELGMSRNQFVANSLEYFIKYLKDARAMAESDE